MAPSLNLPDWTLKYPALRAALHEASENPRHDAARTALRRILDYPSIEESLSPLLPSKCSDEQQRSVSALLDYAALQLVMPNVKAPLAQLRKHARMTDARALRNIALRRPEDASALLPIAAKIECEAHLINGAEKSLPNIRRVRPGKGFQHQPGTQDEPERIRGAALVLHTAAMNWFSEPYNAQVATLLNIVFDRQDITPRRVRDWVSSATQTHDA